MADEYRFTLEEAKMIGDILGMDWASVPWTVNEFQAGLEVELEHGLHDPQTNISNDDPYTTGKIAWAHLKELPDYYERLAEMEDVTEHTLARIGTGTLDPRSVQRLLSNRKPPELVKPGTLEFIKQYLDEFISVAGPELKALLVDLKALVDKYTPTLGETSYEETLEDLKTLLRLGLKIIPILTTPTAGLIARAEVVLPGLFLMGAGGVVGVWPGALGIGFGLVTGIAVGVLVGIILLVFSIISYVLLSIAIQIVILPILVLLPLSPITIPADIILSVVLGMLILLASILLMYVPMFGIGALGGITGASVGAVTGAIGIGVGDVITADAMTAATVYVNALTKRVLIPATTELFADALAAIERIEAGDLTPPQFNIMEFVSKYLLRRPRTGEPRVMADAVQFALALASGSVELARDAAGRVVGAIDNIVPDDGPLAVKMIKSISDDLFSKDSPLFSGIK